MRCNYAKKTGLYYNALNDINNIIVYDERIGKILYSYTESNPDYSIPDNPILIRIEDDITFILSLVNAKLITVWQKKDDEEYDLIKNVINIDEVIEKELVMFREKAVSIPLHQKLN